MLQELTLAGNRITTIPPAIAKFTSLKRLQAAGNRITGFPDELTQLTELEVTTPQNPSGFPVFSWSPVLKRSLPLRTQEIWAHGNAIESLPENIGALTNLWRLSLAGNRLSKLPESMGQLESLKDLSLSGNQLQEVPAWIGNLSELPPLQNNCQTCIGARN